MIGFGDYTVVSMIVSAGDYSDVVSIGRYAHPNPSRPFSRTSLETNKRDVPSHTFSDNTCPSPFGADVDRDVMKKQSKDISPNV